MSTGKSSGGSNPGVIGGSQPSQDQANQFSQGIATTSPGNTADQMNQIAGGTTPAMNVLTGQQLGQGSVPTLGQAPLGMSSISGPATDSTSPQSLFNQYASVVYGQPAQAYQPNFNQAPMGMSATPISLPGGQQLDLSQAQTTPQALYNNYATQIFGQPANANNPFQQAIARGPQTTPVKQLPQAQMPTKAAQGYQSRVAPKPVVKPTQVLNRLAIRKTK